MNLEKKKAVLSFPGIPIITMEGTHILTKLRMFVHQTPALMSLGQSNVGWGENH